MERRSTKKTGRNSTLLQRDYSRICPSQSYPIQLCQNQTRRWLADRPSIHYPRCMYRRCGTQRHTPSVDLDSFSSNLISFYEIENTVYKKLFYTESHRGMIYVHCLIDAINVLYQDHSTDILRIASDVLVINWIRDSDYVELCYPCRPP